MDRNVDHHKQYCERNYFLIHGVKEMEKKNTDKNY